ncbi:MULTISPECIES: hypothetical protein [Sporosarcina]|uniref:Uncharacterized protein n=1 Tax=Sporosarcina contaminans TaxID=633403 RepID=A0ABW3U0B9_9BACL
MSLFFEDEIRKVQSKIGPDGLKEMMAQDPRRNGQLEKNNSTNWSLSGVRLDPKERL